jgi:hypothetical protein
MIAQPCYRRYKLVRHRGKFVQGVDRKSDHLERFHVAIEEGWNLLVGQVDRHHLA